MDAYRLRNGAFETVRTIDSSASFVVGGEKISWYRFPSNA